MKRNNKYNSARTCYYSDVFVLNYFVEGQSRSWRSLECGKLKWQ